MNDLEHAIAARRSIRRFLSRPVPRQILDTALELAQQALSNSNIQPWRLVIATGARRDRLAAALGRAARAEPRPTAPLPASFQGLRAELGSLVYGSMGISRQDKEARKAAVLRNYEFFGAPTVAVVCIHRDLGPVDALGVGMYLQTLTLLLTAQGVGTCVQAALATYADVIRQELAIPDELVVLCGMAIGFADEGFATNHIKTPRHPVDGNVLILDQ